MGIAHGMVRVGRLTVDLAVPSRLADASGGGTHDDVQFAERPWTAELPATGPERDAARERGWAARITDALHADPPDDLRGTPDGDAGIFILTREATLAHLPWARAVQEKDPTFDFLTYWWIAADAGPLALVAEGQASTEIADEALQRYLDVLDAYVLPDAPGFGDADWLYLRYGAVARAPRGREVVRATFADHPAFEELTVLTLARVSPTDEPSLLARWRAAQHVGLRRMLGAMLSPGADADAREVRVGAKAAGTLAGEEVVTVMRAGPAGDLPAGIHLFRFEWEHRGTPGDGHDPDISVTAVARSSGAPSRAETAAALAAWDALLASVRVPRRVAADIRLPAGPYALKNVDLPPLLLPPGPAAARGPKGWLEVPMPWERTGNGLYPYDARVDGTRFLIEVGDFPDEDLYWLYIDGYRVTSFNNWPAAWEQP